MSKTDRILVVDDEDVIRELMVGILEDEGFQVDCAPNGKCALELLQENDDFVVLFTDIMMPEMDGLQLIRKAAKLHPSLVSIVMTGYATMETARDAVKAGAYDYVLKPFNLSEIIMAVTNALERFRLSNENARLKDISELFDISESIAALRDEKNLLDFTLNAALERVSAKRGSIMIVSNDGKRLEVACSIDLPKIYTGKIVDLSGTISGFVAENIKPLLVENIRNHPEISGMSLNFNEPSFISVPLERKSPLSDDNNNTFATPRQRVLAVLNITDKESGAPFSESDLKILSIIANHAASALENLHLIRDIEEGQREILFRLGEIVETRSRETGNHVKRVAEYCKLLASMCGLSKSDTEILGLAAPLHDVGKVGIPDAILNKPGKLTNDEFDIIKTHSTMGYDMLKASSGPVLQAAALIAHQHHERFNGKGYPQGLKGKDIHIYGRITGIADVFDALGVERLYKKAWGLERILELFKQERGQHFDPELTDVFFDHLDGIITIRDAFPESTDTQKG